MPVEAVYRGLPAEVYDLWFGTEPFEDQHFFQSRLREAGGTALEVACGTGRLLVPFLRDGLDVEGADISAPMLEICRAKAEKIGLRPRLYEQAMERMDLPRKYRCIYIPYCSFQMLRSREDAAAAIGRFHSHLEPGGRLMISIFLPWHDVASTRRWWLKRTAALPDGSTVLMDEAVVPDRLERSQVDYYRYQVFAPDGRLLQTELRTVKFLWYLRDDLEETLSRAGFRNVRLYGGYTDRPAEEDDEVWVVTADRV